MTATTAAYVKERKRYARWIGQSDVPPTALLQVSMTAFRTLLNEGQIKYDPIQHTIGDNPLRVCREAKVPFYFRTPYREGGAILFVGGPYDHKIIMLSDWPDSLALCVGSESHVYKKTLRTTTLGAVYSCYEHLGPQDTVPPVVPVVAGDVYCN